MNTSKAQFSFVSPSHGENLENKIPEYAKAETNKQKGKIKIIVFGVSSSVSKHCDCFFFLMVNFGDFTVSVVVNPFLEMDFEEKSAAQPLSPKIFNSSNMHFNIY